MRVPLAARILELLEESGASQIEIVTALNLLNHLRHGIKLTPSRAISPQ